MSKTTAKTKAPTSEPASDRNMVSVQSTLIDALNAGLAEVSIIGRLVDGSVFVSSSLKGAEALEAFQNAPNEIYRLSDAAD